MIENLFYAPDIAETSILPENEAQHCIRALRCKAGSEINIADGKGFLYRALIEVPDIKNCKVKITERLPRPLPFDYQVHIAVAPTKNIGLMEWLVEKTTEVGVNAVSFLNCRNSERKEIKTERLQKIVVSALKQSQQFVIPQLNDMTSFKEFVNKPFTGCKMIAHCNRDFERRLIKDVYSAQSDALILIGPEGDFSPEEIEMAEAQGFTGVSLGENRLRTETAAITSCITIHLLNQ
ncbi:MAG: 16S rRNA (uracil(1498)-N(3))-methyltransferase [Tannerella sp.]|jgi:16S rRNA (uracil1498-N3)-methyltransferase|nr:16S rRNA (uracil(1498)-N(3))-methyltransferase [Tannerella sp.]